MNQTPPFSLQFNLGRIPVVVEPTFWLIMAFFGMSRDWRLLLTWVAAAFVSVLVHELGHALVAMAQGSAVSIRLHSFGGECYHQITTRWRGVLVSLAGPVAGFLFGGLMIAVSSFWPPRSLLTATLFRDLMWVNFGWGIINLLPVLPLDGGHVTLGVLGPTRRRLSLWISVITAGAVVALALSLLGRGGIFIAVMFGLMGFRCYQSLSVEQDVKPVKPVEPEPEALERGWKALRAGNESEAARLGHLALAAAKPGHESNAARDLLAWVALTDGNARAAMSQLEKVDPPQAARPYTLAMAYEAMGLPDRALPHALAALEKEPAEGSASLAVRLLVGAKRLDEAERVCREYAWRSPATKDARLADVAAARGNHDVAAALYASAFEAGGKAEHAYQAALAQARAGQVEPSAEWLKRALRAGYDDLEAISEEPALAEVRALPEVAELLAGQKRTG